MVGLAEQGVESTRVKEKTTIKRPQQMLKIITVFVVFILRKYNQFGMFITREGEHEAYHYGLSS